MKIGIIFGGVSKEREISFAGGRTVYDNLNKTLFEPIPIFVDSFGNFILLDWQYIYKGSIRDFYPPVEFLPVHQTNTPLESKVEFQLYAESLGLLSDEKQLELINKIGKRIAIDDLKKHFDFAFLCLHGSYGEDGRIQGLLEYLQIPYSGSGILPSAIGMSKSVQKKLMLNAQFNSPAFFSLDRENYILIKGKAVEYFEKAKKEIGFPMVIKPANQGSSIGITILYLDSFEEFMLAVEKALFTRWLEAEKWNSFNTEEKREYIRALTDIREGIGMPVKIRKDILYHPDALIAFLNVKLKDINGLVIEALDGESEVIVEGFVEGREFSCIVIQNEDNEPISLPPTEIKKGKELFDYRSKYLPGLARKITPIDLPREQINTILNECERLFNELHFNVYARIDGFIKQDGSIFLNDPNTTSGMMPSSFFFHQAAEIGLNPSQFLTYIIRTSLAQRIINDKNSGAYNTLLTILENSIKQEKNISTKKIKIAVFLGGYSSERHISVESGRNIFEKLASSSKYEPVPIFLTGNENEHIMYQIPINILLKDNADDIKEKINNYSVHDVVKEIINKCASITNKYSSANNLAKPKQISYKDLSVMVDGVFIALHGRPGEDGAVQKNLEIIRLPYNGSGIESSQITIDKYKTNEILKENGFLIAQHLLVNEEQWNQDKEKVIENIKQKIKFPFIAKPVDDGCSSAVRKIKTVSELEAFSKLIFRKTSELDFDMAKVLNIKAKEEFPQKNIFLVEELISQKDAIHFLEITGGMLTKFDAMGNIAFEVFEASEALSEGEVLSLEEKFLAGQGQNITPARYSANPIERQAISEMVKEILARAAKVLNIEGYTRIDAFVRVYNAKKIEVVFIEANSLPGMTPATCIFHQSALNGYKPYEFIDKIIDFSFAKLQSPIRN